MHKRNYLFSKNIMENIFEIRSCIEILVKDIKIYTIDQYTVSQKNCATFIFTVTLEMLVGF